MKLYRVQVFRNFEFESLSKVLILCAIQSINIKFYDSHFVHLKGEILNLIIGLGKKIQIFNKISGFHYKL